MNRGIARLSPLVSAALLPAMVTWATAAAPHLIFPCSAPESNALVTCQLRGEGFQANEVIQISYRVRIGTAAGTRTAVYRRHARTDGRGVFRRPSLEFAVDPRVLSYRVTVVVTGRQGDHATIETSGTP
jgi:hypothetical protein